MSGFRLPSTQGGLIWLRDFWWKRGLLFAESPTLLQPPNFGNQQQLFYHLNIILNVCRFNIYLSAYLMVTFRSSHEEPSLISKSSGHHHFGLQSMSMPTAVTSIPSNLKPQQNMAAAERCLLEALGIIWKQFRCTEFNSCTSQSDRATPETDHQYL